MPILQYIKDHIKETQFGVLLVAYIIIAILLFKNDPYDIISTYGGLSAFLALLGGFLIIMMLFFIKRKKDMFGSQTQSGQTPLSFLYKILSLLFGAALFFGLVYLTIWLFSHMTTTTSILLFLLNISIGIVLLTLIMKFFKIGRSGDGSILFRLIKNVIFYIPCLLLDFIEFIKHQYSITSKPVWILLAAEILLIALRFLLPMLFDAIISRDGNRLLKEPIYLNNEKRLGTFQELNKKDDKFSYHYALSSWIYINPQPPSTSPAYEDYTSLLNLGNKPNILYNGRTNTLLIKMKTQNDKEKIIYKSKNIKYQKWNNFVINYDGGTLDIFINNELVVSVPGAIPYMSFDNITTGASPGIHGGICNVVYFNNTLSRNKISWLYNSTKNLNPPIL